LISRADCGVAFVHDNGFDTPTKLFDYIAYGIDILILTDGQFGEGAAGELVNGLDRVYWAKNTPEGVSEFLKTYVPSRAPRSSSVTERYSRMSSTRDLIGAIQGILP
jgi:hypothetical protein